MGIPRNTSDQSEWAAELEDKYAMSYRGYMKEENHGATDLPCSTAAECQTVADLKAWRKNQNRQIQTYVPAAYRSGAEKAVQSEFDTNELRINNVTQAEQVDSNEHAFQASNDTTKTDDASSSWPFALAEAPGSQGAFAKATAQADEHSVQLAEQTPNRMPVLLGFAMTLSAFGAVLVKRRKQEPVAMDGYANLVEGP